MTVPDSDADKQARHLLAGHPDLADRFVNFLARCTEVDLDAWLAEVDESDYSLADWAEALLEFDAWLSRSDIVPRPFSAMTGYVHCCATMNSKGVASPRLKVIVGQALTDFGFQAVSDSQ